MAGQRKKRRKLRISRVIILSILILSIIAFVTVLGVVFGIARNLPDWKADDLAPENTSFIYDSQDNLVMKLHKTENRTSVELNDMPPYLIDAFIATEDARFWKHHGVDIKRIAGALVADIRNRGFSQGASTITMQLVRNAILEDQEKKLERKIKEAILAIQVERQFTKEEILTFYLNEIYFGHGAYGVEAASQTYFGKNVGELTLGESAMITGVVKGFKYYSPFLNMDNAIKRRDVVLNNMVRYGKISAEQAEEAKKEPVKLTDFEKRNVYAFPWFTDYVVDEAENLLEAAGYDASKLYTGGLRIYSTLDPNAQKAAEEVYENNAYFPQSSSADPIQSALAVLDPKTGEIRALIGGREHVTKRGLNRATAIQRQPGSSIKPLSVYAPALEKGYSPASVVDDVPVSFGSSSNPYRPENYDGKYRGFITMREAVRLSVNVPAVKFLNEIGVSEGFSFAKKLGLPLDDKNDKNLSLALGGLTKGVSPLDMAAAYGAFSNQGVYIEPHAITKITDHKGNVIVNVVPKKEIVMSEQTAYLMTDMLKTVVDSGTGTRAKMNRPVAGKTGTTQLPEKAAFRNVKGKGNKDAWFAGYTPELVGVVWMGYDEDLDKNGKPQYLKSVYGGKFPAMIWKTVMEKSLKNVPAKPFTVPSGIVHKAVDIKSGKLPSNLTPDNFIRNEIFAQKNVPTEISDVWVTATIDPESKLLANEYCPVKITGVFLKRPQSYSGRQPLDANLALPVAYCNLHGGNHSGTGNELTALCTDPHHGETPFLANLPREAESGGCPQDYIRFVNPEQVPSGIKHCDLSEHQIIKNTSGTTGSDSSSAPAAPRDLKCSVVSRSKNVQVTLSWKASNSQSLFFKIERWPEENPNAIVTFRSYETSYTDNSVEPNKIYFYRVFSVNQETMDSSKASHKIKVSTKH